MSFMQLIVTGLVIGSVYALVAMGFALIYKSTSIINFAQGEFVLVGGYVCLWLYTDMGMPIGGLFISMVIAVLMGVLLERLILRPMIGEPIISVIMVTIALATVLKSLVTILWSHPDKGVRPAHIQPGSHSNSARIRIPRSMLMDRGLCLPFSGDFRGLFQVHPGGHSHAGGGQRSAGGPEYGHQR
jgi:branched-chain amino acid transport system permease protein